MIRKFFAIFEKKSFFCRRRCISAGSVRNQQKQNNFEKQVSPTSVVVDRLKK